VIQAKSRFQIKPAKGEPMKLNSVIMLIAGMLLAGTAAAQSGAELAKSKNCTGCHELDKKKVGPAFKDVAAKYKDNKEAEAKLVGELKDGKGHPVKVAATDAELKTLVQYVLSQK
jgi:cytochrome c